MSDAIDIDDYTNRGAAGAIELSSALITASRRAMAGLVTYVYSSGEAVSCIGPVEMGERYEHAAEVTVQPRQYEGTAPVLTAGPRRRFLGVF